MASDSHETVTRPILPLPQPTIDSRRLTLRPITVSDVPSFHSLRNQLPVMRFLNDPQGDPTPAATLTWLEKFLPPNDSRTFFLAVILKETGALIGSIGCHIPEAPECGYLFCEEEWNKGYATEALKAWLEVYWALPRKNISLEDAGKLRMWEGPDSKDTEEILLGTTNVLNSASSRVLEKAGFKERRQYTLEGQPMREWVLKRPVGDGR
ncbi:MAG: hypothetical protein Q9160_003848 [Pyrenula sp. 1 TL-2023]